MKQDILRLLKENSPEFVSGEDICKKLNVTRTAVWKHIQSLREDGYDVEARPRAGYRLVSVPDRLYPLEIVDGLKTRFIGRKIFYADSLSSTNTVAKELVRSEYGEGSMVVAEMQTGGKGRLGRGWSSPKYKGIWFSLILFPRVNPSEASQITMLTAVAVATAIRFETGLDAGIKWPNDLLLYGKKICGILVELSAEMERINHLVIGTGINANQDREDFPEEFVDKATSLKLESGHTISRVKLLQACLLEFERWYTLWLGSGFSPVLAKWKELTVTLNCPVRLTTANKTWEGWAEDVDDDGALMLRLPDGELKKFVSGDVSLRKI